MKLTSFISDVGRAIAYYPNLKKVTGSTTSSILLCQFLYWIDKTKDGWIWKTTEEIEEETGLTYNEQRTAKKQLVDLQILEVERKRLSHMSRYRINTEVLNDLWELSMGRTPFTDTPRVLPPIEEPLLDDEFLENEVVPQEIKKSEDPRTRKKGDLVDAMLAFGNTKEAKTVKEKDVIKGKISTRLHVNPDNRKWEDFIDYAYARQNKDNQAIDKFIDWALDEGYDPIYWPPDKMKTLWPRAFMSSYEPEQDFIKALPAKKKQDEEYAEMPKDLGRKRDLQ